MAVAAQTKSKTDDGHVAPKRRAKYAPKQGRGVPKMIYFDKKDASVEKIVRALRRNSCCIVRNLVSNKVMDQVMGELQPYLDKTPHGEGEFVGMRTRRACSLVAKSKTLGEKLAIHPLVLEVMDKMLLDRCHNYTLATTTAVSIGKGESLQPLHRDDSIYPFKHPSPESVITTIWAGTDMTEESGATQAVPGSHRWDDRRLPKRGEVIQAVMPKGSVIFYMGSMYHGGAENFTDGYRTGIILGYSMGWLRQEENQYLACPPKVAKKFPEKLQRLIGYNLHPPFLGWYETNDPHVLLEGATAKTMAAAEMVAEGDTGKNLRSGRIKRTGA
jgi:ectoine hydroxylase-related dioxygenase (phytanoyl-CoA dioxygenase family)